MCLEEVPNSTRLSVANAEGQNFRSVLLSTVQKRTLRMHIFKGRSKGNKLCRVEILFCWIAADHMY